MFSLKMEILLFGTIFSLHKRTLLGYAVCLTPFCVLTHSEELDSTEYKNVIRITFIYTQIKLIQFFQT